MEKTPYRTSEESGINLKNSEKKLVYLNTLFISIFAILIFFAGFLTASMFVKSSGVEYILIFLLICVIIFLSYSLSRYFLGRSFKMNYLLNLLLKDTLHELNIPLSVIKANTQMLSSGEKDEKKIKKYQRIQKASDELYKLYEDIDYFIKKETKNEIREKIELGQLVKEEIDKFKILYPEVNIDCKIENFYIYIDRRGFSKVIGNLLANALKYNRNNNDISVYFSYNSLIIEDNGIGMSESELFLIFDRYYQGKRDKDGFGIGLDMVKAFCDEHHIFINIDSTLNKGTKVRLDLNNILFKV